MARFDRSKDRTIYEKEIGSDGKVLKIAVMSYNDGEMKLQIGPRTYIKRNGDVGYNKAGRMTLDEVMAITDLMPEIKGIMGESISTVVNG